MEMTMKENTGELLTARKTAELLNIPEKTLQRYRSQGEGPPFIKIGGLIRYNRQALEQYLCDQTYNGGRSA